MYNSILKSDIQMKCCYLVLFASLFTVSAFKTSYSPLIRTTNSRLTSLVIRMSSSFEPAEGWRTKLSPSQFAVLREKSTEPPYFSERSKGELEYELKNSLGTKYPKEGVYNCVGCGTPLYTAKSKFDSGCGWPAFYEGVPGAIKELPDTDGRRIEIVCSNCGNRCDHHKVPLFVYYYLHPYYRVSFRACF